MAAVRIAGNAYLRKGPPWARRGGGFAVGRLAYPPGTVPPHLKPYLLKPGDVRPIVEECRREGKGGEGLVKCIYTKVGLRRSK